VYLIADLMHTSGLLAVVMAGLMVGSYGRRVGISDFAREPVENVWDFASYVVTSLLFLLLGLKIGASLTLKSIAPTLWAALGVFVARAVIVYGVLLPYNGIARWYRQRHAHARARGRPIPLPGSWRPLIVLSGLRGALSIALALSLPTALPNRDLMSSVVYGVVLITLIGQGIGLRALLPHWPNLHDGPDGQVSQHVERETESTGTSSQPSSQT
jgi:CPA1 family monovalent cation:H+ antiporter